ncbi:toll/interleukin-1 receptor domain-containing protein [Photobacterium leiognathi]|uniref:toll/interleukin-1 receptor domain-containing protein n=1 Tax=Photobacterium leiognathi TaxID=553611 RepID=UPI0015D08F6E|nr:toll/interleukin-1 receptor domain-containing protein [Photobacterium leiognathi]
MKYEKIFISYSWDSEEHKAWTLYLANRLEEFFELNVEFDQYDLDSFSDKNHFMEKGIFNNDLVLVVATEKYNKKANERIGGVGIESKMSASRHWDETLSQGGSNIIPILREGDNLPNYLKEKCYIDFRSDDKFDLSFNSLLDHITGKSKVSRPKKKLNLVNKPPHQDLTRIEDFLKINYKKRTLVFDRKESTDYSNGQKIKFELWETTSPSIHHYLFLFNNIVIKKTIKKLCELIKRDSIRIKHLTVLKTGGSEKGYLEKVFKENGINIELTELTYPEYIWDFCIDDSAKSEIGAYISPNFIDQSLVSNDENQDDLGPAFDYIKKQLQDKTQSTANVIIAPGGTGKTTLCSWLANYYQKQDDVIAVLLQSEEIKKSAGYIKKQKIKSVYDLYETYASICIDQDDEYVFDKVTFEVALLTGKLILIIDGLDELITLFPEGFDIESFLKSIDELNRELASSKVILTSRNDVFSEELASNYSNLNKYKLIGFDIETCRKYLEKRFSKFSNSDWMIRKALNNIEPLITKDENQRILPFVVDLLASLIETSNAEEGFDFKLSFEGKDYESNADLTDYLVYSILRRESVRQDIEIPINEVLDIFLELATTFSDSFPKKELEEIVNVFYTEKASELTGKLLRNPLITVERDICKFKYDFIPDYFNALSIINSINDKSSSEQFIKLIAKHAFGDSNVFKDVLKYFQSKDQSELNTLVFSIINSISSSLNPDDVFKHSDYKFKAISFFVNLLFNINPSMSKCERRDLINSIFGEGSSIYNLSIYGAGKPIDFSNLHVFNSKFIGFKNFTSSKFENSKFSNCFFDGTHNDKVQTNITPEMFDSCRLGDLEIAIDKAQAEITQNRELLEKELRKFFSCFFQRGRFKDQKKAYIKFSNRVKNIDNIYFDRLLQHGVINVNAKKSDEIYYIVSPSFQDSVYSFLMNNTVDDKLRKIISWAD